MIYHFKFSKFEFREQDLQMRMTATFDTFKIAIAVSRASILCTLHGFTVGDYIMIYNVGSVTVENIK